MGTSLTNLWNDESVDCMSMFECTCSWCVWEMPIEVVVPGWRQTLSTLFAEGDTQSLTTWARRLKGGCLWIGCFTTVFLSVSCHACRFYLRKEVTRFP